MLPNKLKAKLESKFLAEETIDDGCLAFEASRRFLNGITIWKEKTRLAIPLELAIGFMILLISSIIIDDVVSYPRINVIEKFIAYNITYPVIVECLVILKNKQILREISLTIDRWWEYAYLENETLQLKKMATAWLEWFSSRYYLVMIGGFVSYLLLPIFKYFYNDRKDIHDILLYHCWTPFEVHCPSGFALPYILEVVGLYLPFFTYAGIGTYMVTMTELFSRKVDLIAHAFATIQKRVERQSIELHRPDSDYEQLYCGLMQAEISNCARDYQRLYWCLARMCGIFAYTTNLMYYNGLCVVVYAGLQMVTKISEPLFVIQSIVLIFAVFVNQYLNSYVTESLDEKAHELRNAVYGCGWHTMPLPCRKSVHLMVVTTSHSPQLTTILGTVCNKESFMAIINASYCYINTLITMRIHL